MDILQKIIDDVRSPKHMKQKSLVNQASEKLKGTEHFDKIINDQKHSEAPCKRGSSNATGLKSMIADQIKQQVKQKRRENEIKLLEMYEKKMKNGDMYEKLYKMLKAKLEREEPLVTPKAPIVEPATPPKKTGRANGKRGRRLTQNMGVGLIG